MPPVRLRVPLTHIWWARVFLSPSSRVCTRSTSEHTHNDEAGYGAACPVPLILDKRGRLQKLKEDNSREKA